MKDTKKEWTMLRYFSETDSLGLTDGFDMRGEGKRLRFKPRFWLKRLV